MLSPRTFSVTLQKVVNFQILYGRDTANKRLSKEIPQKVALWCLRVS